MKFFLNILPALCFFLTYKLAGGDLIWATIAIVISSIFAFTTNYVLFRSISRFQIVILAVLLIFAIPTILLNDPSFIKLKVSIVNIALALILFITQFGFRKNIAEAISGIKNPIPNNLWQKSTIATVIYLMLCAVLNYILAFKLPDLWEISPNSAEDIWVGYKTYGNAIINFIFIMIISCWVMNKLTDTQRKQLEILLTDLKKQKKIQKQDK